MSKHVRLAKAKPLPPRTCPVYYFFKISAQRLCQLDGMAGQNGGKTVVSAKRPLSFGSQKTPAMNKHDQRDIASLIDRFTHTCSNRLSELGRGMY